MSLERDSEARSTIAAGTLIAGKYRVGGVIAAGGMGVVVDALHVELAQEVAIKLLHSHIAAKPELRDRFLREARAAARLRSDHVVRVFDVGTHESIPYMVMERLDGSDLASECASRGTVPVTQAVDWVLEALDAVAEAHELGIVHRDLKPSNLYLVRRTTKPFRPRVKVLDFGISKMQTESVDGQLTGTGLMLGSPSYMSPEQVRDSKNVDARSDVWSVGVILWELLASRPAYPGSTLGDIFVKIREEPLPPIRQIRAEVPATLEVVLSRCLERDRDLRYPDAAALREALGPFGSRSSAYPPAERISVAPEGGSPQDFQAPAFMNAPTMAADVTGAPSMTPKAVSQQQTAATWTHDGRAKKRSLVFYVVPAVIVIGAATLVMIPLRTAVRPEPSSTAAVAGTAQSSGAPSSGAPSPSVAPVASAPAPEPSAAPPSDVALPTSTAPKQKPLASKGEPSSPAPRASGAARPAPPPAKPPKKDDLGI